MTDEEKLAELAAAYVAVGSPPPEAVAGVTVEMPPDSPDLSPELLELRAKGWVVTPTGPVFRLVAEPPPDKPTVIEG
jgi:hypothetical protein